MISKKSLALVLMFLFLSAASVLAVPSPKEEVRLTVDEIMRILNDKSVHAEERNKKLEELIRDRFDFPVMSQWILGVHWRKATPQQRDRFVTLFTDLLEANYKDRIAEYADQYTDEKVDYKGEQIKGNYAMVDTFVVTKDKRIPISYKLVKKGNEWKAYDVVIEEVSLVRNYRSTYDEIVRKEGFNGLFSRMEQKISTLKSAPPGTSSGKGEALPAAKGAK